MMNILQLNSKVCTYFIEVVMLLQIYCAVELLAALFCIVTYLLTLASLIYLIIIFRLLQIYMLLCRYIFRRRK